MKTLTKPQPPTASNSPQAEMRQRLLQMILANEARRRVSTVR